MKETFLVILALVLSGCAYTTAYPVVPGKPHPSGIPIFAPKPILIVTPQQTSIVFVPNYEREYAVQFGAFLTKNNSTLEVDGNGVIKKVTADLDGTITKDLLDFAKGVIAPQSAGKAMSETVTGGPTNRFGVFEFTFDDTGRMMGLRPLPMKEEDFLLSQPAPAEAPSDGGSVRPK